MIRLKTVEERPLRAHFLIGGLAAAALLVIHAPTVASALTSKDDGTLNVAALAPLASALLIWNRRGHLADLPATPWWPGLAAMALSALGWILGDLANINALRELAVVAMLFALLATALGLTIARVLAVPMLFLLFAVNVFFPLTPLLMRLTAVMSVQLLSLTGLPAYLNGLTILTPAGRWQVIEGCSGLDYMLIFAMAASLFASVALNRTRSKILFVLASIATAILANCLRAWAIVYSVYLRGGIDVDHSPIGYAAFSLVFALFFSFGYWISRSPSQLQTPQLPLPRVIRAHAGNTALAAAASLAIAGSASAAASTIERHSRPPAGLDGCQETEQGMFRLDGAVVQRIRIECNGRSRQEQLPDIASGKLRAIAPEAALVSSERQIERGLTPKKITAATLTTLETPEAYRLTYWYEFDGAETDSRVELKWRIALARLMGSNPAATIVMELQRVN